MALRIFLLLNIIIKTSFAQQKQVSAENGKRYLVYWSLKSANLAPIDSVEGLVISCDKIDSIGKCITKYKNLKYLVFGNCTASFGTMTENLSAAELDLYNRRGYVYDSLKIAKSNELINSGRGHSDPMLGWDSLLFINHIKYISKEFFELKSLEFINIQCGIDKKLKKKLLKYQKEKKCCLFINEIIKCKEYELMMAQLKED